jgi:glutamine amidotransferase
MCRWLAYSGTPLTLEELLYTGDHSLIDQSLHSRFGAEPTNGDGFGVGWYDEDGMPGVFRSIEPAWNDANLREISPHIRSGRVLAHIRAAIGSPVQQTNCHPFRYEKWLFMHNGFLGGFHDVKRDLMLEIDPTLFAKIQGSADTEVLFHLALTYGLEDDPVQAMERAVGFVEAVGHKHGIEFPIQMSVAVSDGDRLWGFRYASDGAARTLFFSSPVPDLRRRYPDNPLFQRVGDESRLVVSEPLGDVAGVWNMVPESSYGIVQDGPDVLRPFTPTPPKGRVTKRKPAAAGATT